MNNALPVMEHFYTLQGEGFHQGKAAYFIRLGGCDVGCVWCDVKDSWDVSKHPLMSVEEIIKEVVSNTSPSGGGRHHLRRSVAKALEHRRQAFGDRREGAIVVITGGEPLMHNLDELTRSLKASGLKTHLETSGAYPLSGVWDWICLSPKKFKPPLPGMLPVAHELKVVIYNHSDFEWAEKYAAAVSGTCRLYLQPEWSKAVSVMPSIIEYIKDHPRWELSLQIHKYINVP